MIVGIIGLKPNIFHHKKTHNLATLCTVVGGSDNFEPSHHLTPNAPSHACLICDRGLQGRQRAEEVQYMHHLFREVSFESH